MGFTIYINLWDIKWNKIALEEYNPAKYACTTNALSTTQPIFIFKAIKILTYWFIKRIKILNAYCACCNWKKKYFFLLNMCSHYVYMLHVDNEKRTFYWFTTLNPDLCPSIKYMFAWAQSISVLQNDFITLTKGRAGDHYTFFYNDARENCQYIWCAQHAKAHKNSSFRINYMRVNVVNLILNLSSYIVSTIFYNVYAYISFVSKALRKNVFVLYLDRGRIRMMNIK